MIIKFSNLGSIKETELDLRPLTVIIGPNNSNKTYIAYSVYGLWKRMNYDVSKYIDIPFNRERGNRVSLRINNATIKLINEIIKERKDDFKGILEEFFQDSSGRMFLNTHITLALSKEEIISKLQDMIGTQKLKIVDDGDGLTMYSYLDLSLEKDVLYIGSEKAVRAFSESTLRLEGPPLLSTFFKKAFSRPILLPSERNTLIITYKILANRRYRLLRETQRGMFNRNNPQRERQIELLREQGDIRYPRPIEDFLDFLTDIEFLTDTRINPDQKNDFQALADKIEDDIQNKNKTVLASTKLGGKEIRVNVKRGLSIDLYNASSSIKQLAPLLLYLRYRAAENDLLIIDEPELGLHPESQAKLLEALAILVNLGVKVLLTTHSPYFIAHLNNLLNGEIDDARILKKQASHLYMKDARAFLREDQVSAYEMQDHKGKGYKLCSLKDDYENFGIRWGSFSDVSADLQQKFFEISEEKETVPHG